VTDRAVLVLSAGKLMPAKPKSLIARLPRATVIGPLRGLYGSIEALGPRKLWVHRRVHEDAAAADAELA
jgi:hypothetical protein